VRRAIVAVIALASVSTPTYACSWQGISFWNVAKVLPSRFGQAESVIRGRVESVKVRKNEPVVSGDVVTLGLSEQVATLVVLDVFKGEAAHRIVIAGGTTMCAYQFEVGEEKIYFITKGSVGVPSVEPTSSWLISALAALQAASIPNTSLERTRAR
jgi:hypothetical protein